ncbi:MAG: hypothetical protein Q9219_004244 [cf. Caloplaca sp. 3 TL-2023]
MEDNYDYGVDPRVLDIRNAHLFTDDDLFPTHKLENYDEHRGYNGSIQDASALIAQSDQSATVGDKDLLFIGLGPDESTSTGEGGIDFDHTHTPKALQKDPWSQWQTTEVLEIGPPGLGPLVTSHGFSASRKGRLQQSHHDQDPSDSHRTDELAASSSSRTTSGRFLSPEVPRTRPGLMPKRLACNDSKPGIAYSYPPTVRDHRSHGRLTASRPLAPRSSSAATENVTPKSRPVSEVTTLAIVREDGKGGTLPSVSTQKKGRRIGGYV